MLMLDIVLPLSSNHPFPAPWASHQMVFSLRVDVDSSWGGRTQLDQKIGVHFMWSALLGLSPLLLSPADERGCEQSTCKEQKQEQVLSGAARGCLCFSRESRSRGRRGTRFPALLLRMYLTKATLATKHAAGSFGLLSKPFKPTLC